jgi:hypothetical protein
MSEEHAWTKPHEVLDELLDGDRKVFYAVGSLMNDTAIVGTVVMAAEHDGFWGMGEDYVSEPITNPTWLELAVLADKMIRTTGDYHHIFFENVRGAGSYRLEEGLTIDGYPVWEFIMGS